MADAWEKRAVTGKAVNVGYRSRLREHGAKPWRQISTMSRKGVVGTAQIATDKSTINNNQDWFRACTQLMRDVVTK